MVNRHKQSLQIFKKVEANHRMTRLLWSPLELPELSHPLVSQEFRIPALGWLTGANKESKILYIAGFDLVENRRLQTKYTCQQQCMAIVLSLDSILLL